MSYAKRQLEKQRVGKGFIMDAKQLEAYNQGWAKTMVTIMAEQIDKLKINDTTALRSSIRELISTGTVTTIEHRFLMYGIYVTAGVGKGFSHGNGGDLLFMGDEYRQANGYRKRQVGAGLTEHAMNSPKYEHITVKHGKNAGKEAALTSGKKREKADWFFRKYYYSLHRLNETNAGFFGAAYQGLTSSFLEELFSSVDQRKTMRTTRF